MSFFPGFEQRRVKVGDVTLNVRTGGNGNPLLLLHGYPQTHVAWHKVAPELARSFTVICPDLKGYGDSDAPAPTADSGNYSKRVMGAEMLALMKALGHPRFAMVGHDRGARIAYRLALDHPEAVTRLGILDILPTAEYWDLADRKFAVNTFHWGFLARDGGLPERLIGHDPEFFQDYLMRLWAGEYGALDPAGAEGISPLLRQARKHRRELRRLPRRLHHRRRTGPRRQGRRQEDWLPGPRPVRRPVSLDRREPGRRYLAALGNRRARQRDPERALRGGGEAAGGSGGAGAFLEKLNWNHLLKLPF